MRFSLVAFLCLAAGCSKPDASTTNTTSSTPAAQPAGHIATPGSPAAAATPKLTKVALGGSLKGLSVDAPEGASFDDKSDAVKVDDHFSVLIMKGKTDLNRSKQDTKRDLQGVAIVDEGPEHYVYEFSGLGKNYGFRANVKVGKDWYWCMNDLGFFERSDMDKMLKSCQTLAKAGK